MKVYILGLLACVLACPLAAQNEVLDTSVTVLGYWNKGDTKKYSCAVTEEKSANGEVTSLTTRYNIELKIVDSTATSYVFNAAYRNIKPDTLASAEEKFMARLMEGFAARYSTDENGSFTGLINADEMKKSLLMAFDKMIKKYSAQPELHKVLEAFRPLVSSDDMLAQATEELTMLHFFHGSMISRHRPFFGETEFGNLLGGDPFPAQAKVEVSNVAPDKSAFTITQYTRMDTKSGRTIMLESLKGFYKQLGITELPPDEELLKQLDIKEVLAAQIIAKTGWPRKIEDTRTTVVGKSSTKRSIVITMTK